MDKRWYCLFNLQTEIFFVGLCWSGKITFQIMLKSPLTIITILTITHIAMLSIHQSIILAHVISMPLSQIPCRVVDATIGRTIERRLTRSNSFILILMFEISENVPKSLHDLKSACRIFQLFSPFK